MNKTILAVMILCLSIFAYGCSGESAPENTSESNTENSQSTGSSPSVVESISSIGLMKEIATSMINSADNEYSVFYDSTYEGEVSKLTMYSDGKEKTRFDSLSGGIEIRTFTMDKIAYLCTKKEGWLCIKSADTGATQEPLTELEMTKYEDDIAAEEAAAAESKFKVYRDGTFEVTGHTGKCYGFEHETATERLCISKEGIMLYHKYTDSEGTTEMTATSYSTQVSDSVFTLPEGARIVDLNDEYAGMGDEYSTEIADAERIGSCYDACETQGLSEEAVVECYQACV